MIILYNPWSTPSHKKPLPMSLLAVAALLEGAYEYEIVDGNVRDDPVGYFQHRRRGRAAMDDGLNPRTPRAHRAHRT